MNHVHTVERAISWDDDRLSGVYTFGHFEVQRAFRGHSKPVWIIFKYGRLIEQPFKKLYLAKGRVEDIWEFDDWYRKNRKRFIGLPPIDIAKMAWDGGQAATGD